MADAAKKILPLKDTTVMINGAPFNWGPGGERFTYFGIDAILFWVKPSLVSMLQPLREELGEDFYSRLIAFEVSKGTFEDYQWMVGTEGRSFEEGFAVWCKAIVSCGWGSIRIQSIDWKKKQAVIAMDDPWELKIFECKDQQNHVPFLHGKMSGVFTHAFGTNCRSEVVSIARAASGSNTVILRVQPSNKTLEDSLRQLHDEKVSDKGNLQALNNALRRNERRLLDVIDTVGDFIWESDCNLSFTYATKQILKVLQLRDGEVIGKTWRDLLPVEGLARLDALLGSLGPDVPFVEGEFGVEIADKTVWIHLRAKQLFDFNGNHSGYVGSGRDITDQKNLQSELWDQQKSAEFSAKMATLGEMAGGVAHEINTPLATISILTEQLIEDLESQPALKESAENILKTTERIARIVQGLRVFARDASMDSSVSTPLKGIVDATLELCQSRFKNSGVEVRISDFGEDLMVRCRPTQITQVLLNLLNNSFDAIFPQPEKWISIEVLSEDKQIVIQVTDSGNGIPPEVRGKMMNPFYTTKPIGKGTGLGLSISKGIMESHGGELLYDEASPNTRFKLVLPM